MDIKNIIDSNNKHTTIVAVSKTKPIDEIQKIYNEGQIDFGENRVNELIYKYRLLPKNINWHMIGHLQTNKVKKGGFKSKYPNINAGKITIIEKNKKRKQSKQRKTTYATRNVSD